MTPGIFYGEQGFGRQGDPAITIKFHRRAAEHMGKRFMEQRKNGMDSVTIRPMRIEHLVQVFQLGERLFTLFESPSLYRTWDEYEVIDLYRNDPAICLVAEQRTHVVGFVLATIIDKRNSPRRYGYLVWFGVNEELRGRGIGRRLFAALRKVMEEQGVRMLLVDTEARNEDALRFFEKCGFSSPQDHVYLSLQLAEG